jgi:hypothetical protein
LNLGNGDIAREGGVNVGDHGRERGLVLDTRGGVDDISSDDDGGVLSISKEGNRLGVRDGVDPAEFNVNSARRMSVKHPAEIKIQAVGTHFKQTLA